MINVADRAFLQLMWFPEFDYFFSAMILLVVTSFWNETSAPPLQTHRERNRHSLGSGPLGSGPIGPGSGYSVMP